MAMRVEKVMNVRIPKDVWKRLVILEAVVVVGSILLGCISTTTTTTREVFTEAVIPAGGPQAPAGRRLERNQVAIQGTYEEILKTSDESEKRSGNQIAARKAGASVMVGIHPRAQISASARYIGANWGRHIKGVDLEGRNPNAVVGFGMGVRYGLINEDRLQLDIDTGFEGLVLPYQRAIKGSTTTTITDTNPNDGIDFGGSTTGSLIPAGTQRDRFKIASHVGLQGALAMGAGDLHLLGGAMIQWTPSTIGRQTVVTTCEDFNCSGPESESDIDVFKLEGVFTAWGGLQWDVSQHWALIGVLYSSASIDPGHDDLSVIGSTLSLRLSL